MILTFQIEPPVPVNLEAFLNAGQSFTFLEAPLVKVFWKGIGNAGEPPYWD